MSNMCQCPECGNIHDRDEREGVPVAPMLVPVELPVEGDYSQPPRPVEPQSPHASSRADELAPRDPPKTDPWVAPTCAHGYTVCKPCKFPAPTP